MFKPKDRVICIDDWAMTIDRQPAKGKLKTLTRGKEYIVRSQEKHLVRLDGKSWDYEARRFKLAAKIDNKGNYEFEF